MKKIKIVDSEIYKGKLRVHVEFDTGHKFWFVTHADIDEEDLIRALKLKYKREKERLNTPAKKTKATKLRKKLKNLEIDEVD